MIVRGSPCRDSDLDAAASRLGVALPSSIRALFRQGNGWFSEEGQWNVFWPLADLIERNIEAWAEGTLPRDLLAFGDDGTGNPFAVDLGEADRVVRWDWIDQAPNLHFDTVDDFAAQWLA